MSQKVLVTWGSKRGGTEGIGRLIAERLDEHGFDVLAAPADEVTDLDGIDAAIVGGALYANRWPSSVRRFVHRHESALRGIPNWFFSSGPLDDSADRGEFDVPRRIRALTDRVGAHDHVIFGGRLAEDAEGFPANAMAKDHAGDWRNPQRIRAWADDLADALPEATPNAPAAQPGHTPGRLLGYGAAGWLLRAATTATLLALIAEPTALLLQAVVTPLLFALLAWRYFHDPASRDPLPTAATWTATVALLDLLAAGLLLGTLAPFATLVGTWLPYALLLGTVWATGELMSMMPDTWDTEPEPKPRA